MITLAILVVGILTGLTLVFRTLALRIVGSRPRPRLSRAIVSEDHCIKLPRSPESESAAPRGPVLRFGLGLKEHATLGAITRIDRRTVTRRITRSSVAVAPGKVRCLIAAYTPCEANALGELIHHVDVSSSPYQPLPAWLVEGPSSHWTIHVQGIRTSRDVTLRSMEESVACGSPSLSVTFRGAGEIPANGRCALGQREWRDLEESVRYARDKGAETITIVGWSMGAGIALELAKNVPGSVDRLILIAPATAWLPIVRHGAKRAGLPPWVGTLTGRFLGSRLGACIAGLREPVHLDELRWNRPGDLSVPTIIIHSPGDEEVPFALSQEFARAHAGMVNLIEFPASPHAWEGNADPALFTQIFKTYLRT